jgi:cytochrome c-type biogenesis protein CcmH/NrfF
MNCEEFQTIVGDLAREQIMEVRVRTKALVHGASCVDCAQTLADERSLSVGLRSLADRMKSLEAEPRVEAQLLAAYRNRIDFKPALVHSHRWLYWVGAAAAVLLVVFGVVAMRGRVASPPRQVAREIVKPVESPKSPSVTDQSDSLSAPRDKPLRTFSNPKPPRVKSSKAPSPSTVPTVAAGFNNNEIATDFFPVGDVSALNLQDGGQLVRVELPRSALARFGLPVNMERANQRVKADVLFSADGLARAIRFVQ